MQSLAKFKSIFMILGMLVIAWLFYTYGDALQLSKTASLRADEVKADTARMEEQLLAEIEQIGVIKLDERIFASDSWHALVDWNEPLPEPVLGRQDPFAPYLGARSATK